MAVDAQGGKAALPFVRAAKATYPAVVDAQNVLGEALGYTVVPNGIFVDERGIVRQVIEGGFDVSRPQTMTAVEAFLAEPPAAGAPGQSPTPPRKGEAAALFARGTEALRRGRKAEALQLWRAALKLAPDNYLIRKQIWAVEHPERFYPEIDWDWQGKQPRE